MVWIVDDDVLAIAAKQNVRINPRLVIVSTLSIVMNKKR